MRIHPEGRSILSWLSLSLIILNVLLVLTGLLWLQILLGLGSLVLFGIVLQFFRQPQRPLPEANPQCIYAPADGKLVVIERVQETEYLHKECLQLSIFMSIWDVHVNRSPVSGKVEYREHHPGRYLVAWHPKSSTENERATTVIHTGTNRILFRQIAGAVARRICNYLEVGSTTVQGAEMGFIKFGSRVDIFLPVDAHILVEIGSKVRGGQTVLAELVK